MCLINILVLYALQYLKINMFFYLKAFICSTYYLKVYLLLLQLFESVYAPFLMKPLTRAFVIVVFTFWLCSSVAMVAHMDVGLEEELSMPDDSYVLKYFQVIINEFFFHRLGWFPIQGPRPTCYCISGSRRIPAVGVTRHAPCAHCRTWVYP